MFTSTPLIAQAADGVSTLAAHLSSAGVVSGRRLLFFDGMAAPTPL
jgi:hypothetical protein